MNSLRNIVILLFSLLTLTCRAQNPPCLELICPPHVLEQCQSPDGAYVQYGVSAVSHCQAQVTLSCKPESGTLFPLGETLVTCTATDTLGNSTNCTFSVYVVDTTPPAITAPKSVEAQCQSWMGANVTFQVSATDACDGQISVVCDPPSGSLFPNGLTLVTCTATDTSGNQSAQQFPVTVTGDCGASCVSIVCPQDMTANVSSGDSTEVEFSVTASHLCGGTISRITCNPESGSEFPLGTNLVVCVAEDDHGNTATCTFNVIVQDLAPPTLLIPDQLTLSCDAEDGSAVAFYDVRASDNDDPDVQVTCNPPSGTRFPPGTNPVSCTATDGSGNMAVGSFNVVVNPGPVCGALPELPDAGSPDNWGFELGLVSWSAEGVAFERQPVTGNVLPVPEFPHVASHITSQIGGDYWHEVGYPVGHKGSNWIATGENIYISPSQYVRMGGNHQTGTLVSKPFTVTRNFVTFLIGGGDEPGNLTVQLLKPTGDPNEPFPFETIMEETGPGQESMVRKWFDVSALKGEELRVMIQDRSGKGHLNVDDFSFQDAFPSQTQVTIGEEFYPALIFRDGFWYDWDAPVWGVVDMHTHPMTHLGFGQIVFHGEPDGPIDVALRDCNCSHGGPGFDNPCGNFFRNTLVSVMDGEGPDPHRWGDNSDPWVQYTKWPVFSSISHQQMWYEWIRRAYEGGLRVMVALSVNNQLLGAGALGSGPLDDKTVGDLQIAEMKRFAAAHSDFMEIAYDPYELRQILRDNKLAVIIGVELDDPGNFNTIEGVTADMVREEIRRLHADGVRYIFPIHLTDNKLGGAAIYNDLFNVANKFMTSSAFSVVDAPPGEQIDFSLHKLDVLGMVDVGQAIGFAIAGPALLPALASPVGDAVLNIATPGFPPGTASGLVGAVAPAIPAALGTLFPPAAAAALIYLADAGIPLDVLPIGGNYPDYSAGPHMNEKGLTDLGTNAVREIMRLGMILDVDHMSQRGVDAAIDLAMNVPSIYPLNSGHNTFRETRHAASENNRSTNQLEFIRQTCGIMGIGYGNEDMKSVDSVLPTQHESESVVQNNCAGTSRSFAQSYLYALEKLGRGQVALGTDINGFVMGPGPRFGPQSAFGVFEETQESHPRTRPDQIRSQFDGVAYTPTEGYPILGPSFDGRSVDPDKETEPARYAEGYQFNKEQRDFFVAVRIFKWNPTMSKSEADNFQSRVSDKYDQRRVKELLKGLLIGVTDEPPGSDIFDGDVGTKQQIAKAIYRYEVLGEAPPADVRNDHNKYRRFGQLQTVWRMYHRAYGDNTPMVRSQTGSKQWDINFEGVAHYGLLPDFFQDLSNVGMTGRDLSPLFNGAEHFARMWTKCLAAAESLTPRFIFPTEVQLDGAVISLRFIDTADEYLLEATASLTEPEWKQVEGVETIKEQIITRMRVQLTEDERFFRLRRKP